MPSRNYSTDKYRYGFNGKENDGETGWQDYGNRMYNPKLGRFNSVDPITNEYPELTPYQFASNTPIQAIDLDGLEMFAVNPNTGQTMSGPLNVSNFKSSDGWLVGAQAQQRSTSTPQQTKAQPVIASVHSEAAPLAVQQAKAMAKMGLNSSLPNN